MTKVLTGRSPLGPQQVPKVCLDVKLVGAKPAALVVGAATRAGKEVSVRELRTQLLESQLGRESRAGKSKYLSSHIL